MNEKNGYFKNRQPPTLPIVINGRVVVTVDGINLVDDDKGTDMYLDGEGSVEGVLLSR